MTEAKTVPLDANSSAFYGGVVAGGKCRDETDALIGNVEGGLIVPNDRRTGFAAFWYLVGIEAAQSSVVTDPQTSALFMIGAALRQPDLHDEQMDELLEKVDAAAEYDSEGIEAAALRQALDHAKRLLHVS